MKPVHHHPDNWREALKIISRCPICSENYRTEEAKVFAKNETASLIHITCHNCQSSFVAMVVMLGHGLSSVGMVTDLSYDDVQRLQKALPITTDEMIEAYKQMNQKEFLNFAIKK